MRLLKVNRVYHPYYNWECFNSGFYKSIKESKIDKEVGEKLFSAYFENLEDFQSGIDLVFSKWTKSCEHFLTNPNANRIAWLGQAAACIQLGLPSCFRSGYKLLDEHTQKDADKLAKDNIERWLHEFNSKTKS